MNIESDFHLKPIKRPTWEYRIATWPVDQVDSKVHNLFDGKSIDPVKYQRATFRDGTLQNCVVLKDDNGDIIMKPGNGWDYYVKRVSFNNQIKEDEKVDNENIPHDMICDICLDNKKTHLLIDCNHVCMCGPCANKTFNGLDGAKQECPICRTPITVPPVKLIFS